MADGWIVYGWVAALVAGRLSPACRQRPFGEALLGDISRTADGDTNGDMIDEAHWFCWPKSGWGAREGSNVAVAGLGHDHASVPGRANHLSRRDVGRNPESADPGSSLLTISRSLEQVTW